MLLLPCHSYGKTSGSLGEIELSYPSTYGVNVTLMRDG